MTETEQSISETEQPQNTLSENILSENTESTKKQIPKFHSGDMYEYFLSDPDENTISFKFHDIGKSILSSFIGFGTLIAQHKVVSIIILIVIIIVIVIVAIVLFCVLIPKSKNKQNDKYTNENEQYL